jgi:GT2 family glycosyltransferase
VVSVVVLSYSRPALLRLALASVAAQTYPCLEVIVIDNRSASSAAVAEVVGDFPAVRLIANRDNRGFTGGMNQGLAEASGEYIYLTEDDIELAPDCLAQLMAYLQERSDVGLAGPVMWNRKSPTIRFAGGEFTLEQVYTMRIIGENEPDIPQRRPFDTMMLPGSMVAARTDFLRGLGGFRSDFFMYREDVELCQRVRKAGRTIAVVPGARVYHHEPEAAAEPPMLAFHKTKNLCALYLLHAPLSVMPGFFLRYGVLAVLKSLASASGQVRPLIKAWFWTITHAPRLLTERRL